MQKTILLADDDPGVQRMLCRVLVEENYNVIQASNVEEALKRLNDVHIDLVLLDLTLPPTSGHVFEQIRTKTSLPLILISSGHNQPLEGLDSENEAVLEKPLDLFRLLRTIEKLLEEPVKSQGHGNPIRLDPDYRREDSVPLL